MVAGKNGGQGGIRTLDRLTPMPVFETGTFNHSVTCPSRWAEYSDFTRKIKTINFPAILNIDQNDATLWGTREQAWHGAAITHAKN